MAEVVKIPECDTHIGLVVNIEEAKLIHLLMGSVSAKYSEADMYCSIGDILGRDVLDSSEWGVTITADRKTALMDECVIEKVEI